MTRTFADPLADSSVRSVDALWREFGGHLRNFIRGRVHTAQDAEDILQEVFLKIHQQANSVRNPGKVQAWVYRIARHAVADYHRARGRQPGSDLSPGDAAEILVDETSPGDVHEEVLSWLKPLIDELPEKYREAVRLADDEGLPLREVATRLNLSLSGAKSRVQRGRVKLGELLLACCEVEFGPAGRVVDYQRRGDKSCEC